MENSKRWGIALAGIFLQVALGSVYAWSVFRVPLAKQFHWSISEITLTFTICIFVLGIASFVGGLWLNRSGPRIVALTGGFLYGLGTFLASLSAGKLWWLYLSYGVIGGIGLGFGYIVPVAVLVKWFPDRRGLITGIAVGGFGAGALIVAPLATRLIQSVGVLQTFAYLGIGYLVVIMVTGYFMQNPPEGWKPQGWTPTATETAQRSIREYTLGGALRTWQWWALWLLLFLNTSAGISLISQESPVFQEIVKVSAIVAAGNGWYRQHRQCCWARFLGLGIGFHHPPLHFRRHVPDPGGSLLDVAQLGFCHSSCCCLIHHPHVLWGWFRNHARFHRGLLRLEKRRADLWAHAHGVGFCQRLWPIAHRSLEAGQRKLSQRFSRDRRHHGGLYHLAAHRSSAGPRRKLCNPAADRYRLRSCNLGAPTGV